MYKFNPYAIPSFITALFCLFIAAFVYFKSSRAQANIAFGILGFSCFIWNLGYFMSYISILEKTALFWCKFAYLGISFITPATYNFSVAFVKLKDKKNFIFLSYALAFLFALMQKTNLIVNGVTLHYWGYHTKIGILHNLFLICWLVPLFLAINNFRYGYKNATHPLEKQRAKYMFLAVSFGYLGGVDFLAHYGINIYPFGFLPVIIFVFATAYAIVKYRLMDIAVVITRAVIFLVVYSIVLGIPFILSVLFKNWFVYHLGANWWMGPFGSLFILGAAGPFVYVYLESKAEAILLREQRRYQEILKHTAVDLTRIRNLQKLLDYIAYTVTEAVHISHSAIYLLEVNSDQFILKSGTNLKNGMPQTINRQSSLITWLENQKEPIVCDEIKENSDNNPKSGFRELEAQMKSLNASVVVPCFLEKKLIEILILGEKLSGKIYTSDDLNNFSFLASEAALATENALLYGKIEDEVKQRTEELVGMQKQLIQAEKLATVGTLAGGVAHEINNPLTAILTNVQMLMLAPDTLDDDTKESLGLIEEATKRCRTIVQKLMTYAKKPLEKSEMSAVNLNNVVEKVVSFLEYQLKQDNIRVVFDLIKSDDYLVLGNHNELEQVVTNIVLNARDAVRQVKNGGDVHISIKENEDWINLIIKDEGVGMPKEVLSKIFDPFYTTKDVGKGTGLGLSICQSIIEKHNGSITVHSELNKGSVFTVKLTKIKKLKSSKREAQ